jgi:hypothetical protein
VIAGWQATEVCRRLGVVTQPEVLWGSGTKSGGLTVVISQHATESLAALDLTGSAGHFIARFDQPVVEPLVVSLFVIMDEEFTNGVPQSHFTEENHSVQTFVLHRTHEPFDMWTQIW